MIDLKDKSAVIFGVANEHSIAWSIARVLNEHGCRVALGYQSRNQDQVAPLLAELDNPIAMACDFMDEESIQAFFDEVGEHFQGIDAIVHSAAFAKKEFLTGDFYNITRKGYDTSMTVSAYSLAAIIRYAYDLLNVDASILALSYIGAQKAVPNYNIMGVCKAALEASIRYLAVDLGKRSVRVNALSAGPIATAAASGIDGFDELLENSRERNPLKRNVSAMDVANYALFLCSDLSRNVTGQVLYVDAGDSIV